MSLWMRWRGSETDTQQTRGLRHGVEEFTLPVLLLLFIFAESVLECHRGLLGRVETSAVDVKKNHCFSAIVSHLAHTYKTISVWDRRTSPFNGLHKMRTNAFSVRLCLSVYRFLSVSPEKKVSQKPLGKWRL